MGSYQPDAFNPSEMIRTIHECTPIYTGIGCWKDTSFLSPLAGGDS